MPNTANTEKHGNIPSMFRLLSQWGSNIVQHACGTREINYKSLPTRQTQVIMRQTCWTSLQMSDGKIGITDQGYQGLSGDQLVWILTKPIRLAVQYHANSKPRQNRSVICSHASVMMFASKLHFLTVKNIVEFIKPEKRSIYIIYIRQLKDISKLFVVLFCAYAL